MADYWDFSDVDITPYINDGAMIPGMIEGIGPERKKSVEREHCTRTLIALSEKRPDILSGYWAQFIKLLGTENASSKMAALYIIANLTIGNKDRGFTDILPVYAGLMDDAAVSICGHTATNLGRIANARADLRQGITEKLLAFYRINKNPDRIDLISGYVIKAFDFYYEESSNKHGIASFITSLLNSQSPSTRKLAKEFVKKHNIG